MTPEKLFHELLGLGLNWECRRENRPVVAGISDRLRRGQAVKLRVDGRGVGIEKLAKATGIHHVRAEQLPLREGHQQIRGRPQAVRAVRITAQQDGAPATRVVRNAVAVRLEQDVQRRQPACRAAVAIGDHQLIRADLIRQ